MQWRLGGRTGTLIFSVREKRMSPLFRPVLFPATAASLSRNQSHTRRAPDGGMARPSYWSSYNQPLKKDEWQPSPVQMEIRTNIRRHWLAEPKQKIEGTTPISVYLKSMTRPWCSLVVMMIWGQKWWNWRECKRPRSVTTRGSRGMHGIWRMQCNLVNKRNAGNNWLAGWGAQLHTRVARLTLV